MNCLVSAEEIYGTGFPSIPNGYKKADFEMPQVGDTFLSPQGEVCTLKAGDVRPAGPRLILVKVVPTPESVYKYPQYPAVAPQGYELGEFRELTEADKDKMFLADYGAAKKVIRNFWGKYRYILTPIPTPQEVYGCEFPSPPAGYRLGEFRQLRRGDDWLGNNGHGVAHTANAGGANDGLWRYTLVALPKFKIGDKVVSDEVGGETGVGEITAVYDKADAKSYNGLYRYQVQWSTWYGSCPSEEKYLRAAPAITPTQPTTAPSGYYFTGEYRLAKMGEMYLGVNGVSVITASTDYGIGCYPTWILLPLPPKPQIDGWEAVEFREPKKNEKYAFGEGLIATASIDYDERHQYCDKSEQYWIIRPVLFAPKPAVKNNRWLVEVEAEKTPRAFDVFDYRTCKSLSVISVTPKES